MAYATTNPPRLMVPSLGGGQQWWGYRSTDGSTSVVAANYFSDGEALGMRVADVVLVTVTDSTAGTIAVGSVSAVSTAGATIITGNLQSTL